MNRIVALVVSALLALAAGAQTMRRVELSTQGELPVPTASCVAVDDDGYLWIGTPEGLFRSDGYHAHALPWSDGTVASITRLTDDHCGHLWIGTTQGLFFATKDEGYRVQKLEMEGNTADVSALMTAADGTVWAAVGSTVVHCTADGRLLRSMECQWTGDGYKWVCDIRQTADGRIVLAQCHGGLCVVGDTLTPLPYDSPYEPQTMVADTRRGGLWIGSWGGGILWSEAPSPVGVVGGLRSLVINLQLSLTGDTLWATTMQGLEAYAVKGAGVLEPLSLDDLCLPDDKQILSLMAVDHRCGDVWVAGYEPTTFCVSEAPSHASPTRATLAVDAACYSSPYIYTWHNRSGLCVLHDSDYALIGTLYDGRNTVDATFMAPDGKGGCYFARTATSGNRTVVSHITVGEGKVQADSIGCVEGDVTALYCDVPTQRLWVATHTRVWSVRRGQPRLVLETDGCDVTCMAVMGGQLVANSQIDDALCLAAQGDTCLWVGTRSGRVLRMGRDGVLHTVPEAAMPGGSSIKHIAIDGNGYVWTQSVRYLCEYEPREHRRRVLSADHPLLRMTYINSLCRLGSGVMAGGVGGEPVVLASSQVFPDPALMARPRVSMVQADSVVRFLAPTDSVVTVKAGTASVVLHLTTLDHTGGQTVTFAYRLHNSSDWMDDSGGVWTTLPAGQNLIYLSALPHGRWTVEVKAADSELCWSQPVSVLTIDRLPAWWQTRWAYLLYIICVAAVGAGIVWLRLRQVQRRQREEMLLMRIRELTLKVQVETATPPQPFPTREGAEQSPASIDKANDNTPSPVGEGGGGVDPFIARAMQLVEDNLSTPGYNVEQLARDLCMERTTLYKRLSTLLDKSPTLFIRSIRLHAAARMLERGRYTVTEVAERTGFNSLSHLSRCFLEEYGCRPSEFAQRKQ